MKGVVVAAAAAARRRVKVGRGEEAVGERESIGQAEKLDVETGKEAAVKKEDKGRGESASGSVSGSVGEAVGSQEDGVFIMTLKDAFFLHVYG